MVGGRQWMMRVPKTMQPTLTSDRRNPGKRSNDSTRSLMAGATMRRLLSDGAEETTGESLDEREQRENQALSEQPEIQNHIQQAIAALQAIDEGLNAT